MTDSLISFDGVTCTYKHGSTTTAALRGVSFDVKRGEALGIVGETGSGKSTLLKVLLRQPPPTSGIVTYAGTDLAAL
jgi:ABC-type oligopeptide transport system ATPase subunit